MRQKTKGGDPVELFDRRGEKKVEYIELIYDLIFVYIIGRNNSLLHDLSGGFFTLQTFGVYAVCTLAVIQIWNFSAYYINLFGHNRVRDHVFLFINMYLLYYMAEGTRLHFTGFRLQYHAAWALILVNVAVQYMLELKGRKDEGSRGMIKRIAATLIAEAALVMGSYFVFERYGVMAEPAAILFGIVMTFLSGRGRRAEMVDFAHLSERAMLYVVFTFGEMVISAASYFEGDFTWNSVYFSLMCFLIIVGLFLCYGVLYNRIIDRERRTSGMLYMLLHIPLIFALNNITTALEFMRIEEVSLTAKILFITASFLLAFICMLGLCAFSKQSFRCAVSYRRLALLILPTAAFVPLMYLFRENMRVNIAVSVLYVFGVFGLLMHYSAKTRGAAGEI
ncbi:MAG: low temperature requirement protein A [Clostridia bacterium]|nr:low temperature requirement protein A [Clostridia bacterium]